MCRIKEQPNPLTLGVNVQYLYKIISSQSNLNCICVCVCVFLKIANQKLNHQHKKMTIFEPPTLRRNCLFHSWKKLACTSNPQLTATSSHIFCLVLQGIESHLTRGRLRHWLQQRGGKKTQNTAAHQTKEPLRACEC